MADAEAHVCQAGDADGEGVGLLEHQGEGGQEEVEDAVDEGGGGREDDVDRGEEDHLCRADDGAEEDLARRDARVEFRAEVRVAGFFLEALGLSGEEGGGICFSHEEELHKGYGAALRLSSCK